MKNLAFIMLARYGHRFLLRATAYAPRGYRLIGRLYARYGERGGGPNGKTL